MLTGSPHNPFAASDLEPRTTNYIFAHGSSLSACEHLLCEHGWNLELVGPHGVGKSTLLYTLASAASRRSMRVVHFRCSDVQQRLPVGWQFKVLATARLGWRRTPELWSGAGPQACGLVCLDGAERIALHQLRRLERICARLKVGLLSTAHVPLRNVPHWHVETTPHQFWQLLQQLRIPAAFNLTHTAASEILQNHNGFARTALLDLYDRYERWYIDSPRAYRDSLILSIVSS